MSGDTDLQRIARIIAISEANVLRFIDVKLHHLKELILSLDSVTADTAQRVANLATEVASANAKVDKLIALASSLGATQAQLDAITAIGAAADAATSQLQAEETKVDAATGATPAAVPAASSAPDAAA
jgi:hypothetical protein